MEPFCNENPISSFKEVQRLFKKEIGKDILDIFEYFEEKPLAVGSIAQVHKAKIIDGPYVAVKIQHPEIIYQTKGDVHVVKQSVALAEYFFEGVKLKWIHKEFEKNMLEEVDFENEKRNIEKALKLFRKDKRVVIPRLHKDYCSKRVLTMTFEEGASICDVNYRKQNNIKVKEISNLLNSVFNKQIFEYGFVHADPHHGNLFIRKEWENNRPKLRLVLLDMGLMINLDKKFISDYSHLWRGIYTQNHKIIEDSCKELGVVDYKVFTSMVTGRDFNEVMNPQNISDTEKRLKMMKGKNVFIF